MSSRSLRAAASRAERFQRALIQSTRALAGGKDLEVCFSAQGPKLTTTSIVLPNFVEPRNESDAAKIRGLADRMALRKAYHDEATYVRYRPTGHRARDIYEALEDMRCQALGARVLQGVAHNLTAALSDELLRKNHRAAQFGSTASMTQALTLLVRERLTGLAPPHNATGLMARWRDELEKRAARSLQQVNTAAADQEQFAFVIHDLVAELNLASELGVPARLRSAAAVAAVVQNITPATAHAGNELRLKNQHHVMEQEQALIADSEVVGSLKGSGAGAERKADAEGFGQRLTRLPLYDDTDNPNRHYRIFTQAHDEVINAERLCDGAELTRLRDQLDTQSRAMQSTVVRLAIRLERLLLTQQTRRWQFDCEEGVLDAARLTRVIIDPLASLSFKEEADTPFKDTVVTILLDNSGSMRGRAILIAALCADVLARTLERCGVKVEILGFTTRAWNGGESREDWLKAARPSGPGRLSDVRYIIYKAADVPWRRARRNLGVLLREDLLKENIDGEALLWAHERLIRRSERRRILMVISDGVPLDEATLSANPGSYLEQHLRNVVKWIEQRSPIELLAIGIGHDVTDFYKRAVAVADVEQLGGAMIQQLADLFVAH